MDFSSSLPLKKKVSFWESQRLAKERAIEKAAKKKKVKLYELAVFTQQLAAMLDAGLPLISALEALEEQTENRYFKVILRDVRQDISEGSSFSEAVKKFPRAFPNLFSSMVEAGEASGALAELMGKIAMYFENSVKLSKKVKSALVYPLSIISLAVVLVNVLLIFVIPVFADMFKGFGSELPKPTQMLIDASDFLHAYIVHILFGSVALVWALKRACQTPKGRKIKDQILRKLPVIGTLTQKISLSRFCRMYAILLKSGVPILRTLEICASASSNTFIENACKEFTDQVSQGGQMSESIEKISYFPSMIKHMAKAGEKTGDIEGMMDKVGDFYDTEIDATVSSLTSLLEPAMICFLGIVIGGIVMAMFLPIFELSSVVAG